MATKYAAEIAETLADIQEGGGPVAFTAQKAARVYDEDTGTWSGGGDLVSRSFAMQLEDDPALYARFASGGLTFRNPITLMVAAGGLAFVPEPLYGEGDSAVPVILEWPQGSGEIWSVAACEAFAPDGAPIYFTVIGDR
jgi:hypothetical protein